MIAMSDAQLNYLCDVYQQERLLDRGVLLATFLQEPDAITRHFRIEFRHPNRQAADPLTADDFGKEVHDGLLCEKLRHGSIKDRPTRFARRLFGRLYRIKHNATRIGATHE